MCPVNDAVSDPASEAGGQAADRPGSTRGIDRRRLLLGGGVATVGAALAVGADRAVRAVAAEAPVADPIHGGATVPFEGRHQAGIEIVPQAHQSLVALDLRPGSGPDEVRRLLTVLTDDARRMTQGRPALGDSEPELALVPARLTVTVGVGPGLVAAVRGASAVPSWLGPLPTFSIDRLEERWSGGDLLLQIASDDPQTVASSMRMLLKDARGFATVRWHQPGFRRAYGSEPQGTTMRNMLGQVDGTTNLKLGSEEFAARVWRTDDWLDGGSTMVIRRIALLQDKWDQLDRPGREASVGRRLDNGAPLTGTREHDEPDFGATTKIGFPVIPEFSHIRRARSTDQIEKFFRRGYNYDDGPAAELPSQAGLLFTTFQADIERQFIPVQARLAELDLLNDWTTPVGSAVFAIPPGVGASGFVGETLFA